MQINLQKSLTWIFLKIFRKSSASPRFGEKTWNLQNLSNPTHLGLAKFAQIIAKFLKKLKNWSPFRFAFRFSFRFFFQFPFQFPFRFFFRFFPFFGKNRSVFFFFFFFGKLAQKGQILQTFCQNTVKNLKEIQLFPVISGTICPFFFFETWPKKVKFS